MYTKIVMDNEVKQDTKILKELISFTESCIGFWNREGAKVYCDNLTGKLGVKETNEKARNTKYPDWLLDSIFLDIKSLVNKYPNELKIGRTSSHVWVHTLENNEERVAMLYIK